jgi:hypothetical protein
MTHDTTVAGTESNLPTSIRNTIEKRAEAAATLDRNPGLLSLDYLEQHDLPVFVRNNANINALITFDILNPKTGRASPVEVPNTDIPLELTAGYTYEMLQGSPGFTKSLRNKTIRLVSPNEAAAILERPDVQRRMKKLETSKFSKDAEGQAPKSFRVTPLIDANPVPGKPDQESQPQRDPVNNHLQALVGEYEAKNLSAEDFEDKVADAARTYKAADWAWLASKVDLPGIQQMVTQQLALLAVPA